MANGKVASFRMELRMAIADAMVNGRDYGEIREYLQGCGVEAADLPSDHSFKTYQDSVEYRTVYEDRMEACNLQLQAGRVAGCASARVALIQHRILGGFEKWLDDGLATTADIFKMFTLTLQYKRQELAERKLALQEGKAAQEALGPQEFSAERLDALMDRLAAERAAQQAEEAQAEQEHAGDPSIPEDIAGYPRRSEASTGEQRDETADGQDADGYVDTYTDDYVDDPDSTIRDDDDLGNERDEPSIPEDIAGYPSIPQDSGAFSSRSQAAELLARLRAGDHPLPTDDADPDDGWQPILRFPTAGNSKR